MRDNSKVHVGRDATGNVITVGSGNRVSAQTTTTKLTKSLPRPESVDIAVEIAALRGLLTELGAQDSKKIERALQDAEEEASKPTPDRDEVGTAIERALKYAQQTETFVSALGNVAPHIANVVAWLGDQWHRLLPYVGWPV